MNPFARLALAGPVAETLARVAPGSPLLRSGIVAVASRYALRSLPVAAAVIGAGLAWRMLRKDRDAPPQGAEGYSGPDKPEPHPA